MARDLYGDARALGADLWEAGLPAWSDRIDEVMRGGVTPTEIIMGLRWTMSELLGQEPDLPAGLRQRATELHDSIDRALG